jgi:hypothetical protein
MDAIKKKMQAMKVEKGGGGSFYIFSIFFTDHFIPTNSWVKYKASCPCRKDELEETHVPLMSSYLATTPYPQALTAYVLSLFLLSV